jgi:biopolymer transport protein TolQ
MNTLIHAILQATVISQCVLVFLLLMSMASWACMAAKWITLRRAGRLTARDMDIFDEQEDFHTALTMVAREGESPFHGIARRGIKEFNRTRSVNEPELRKETVQRALRFGIAGEMARLSTHLPLLATTAGTAPFIGLFGTVWGIMSSFQAIAQLKNVSLATVAPGIAEALIATAVGLFVAIPASMGYNVFKARINSIQGRCQTFAGMFLNRLQYEMAEHPEGLAFETEVERSVQ